MQKQSILNQIGAQIDSYYFTEKELQQLTKTNIERKIVTKLPNIFTSFKEKDFLELPDNTQNFLAEFDFENLENALYEQAENFLCGQDSYEFDTPIYNRKLNQNKLLKNINLERNQILLGYPQYIPQNIDDNTLGFESRFESGNLSLAFKVKENNYELFVDNDVNNQKYTNWFFFRVYNIRANTEYKFTINNLNKSKNLYNHGKKLLVYSQKNKKFYRMGQEIIFYSNFVKKKNNTYCKALSFKMSFQDDFDTIYIMANYPYTFTRVNSLQKYILNTYKNYYNFQKINIGKTLCQNNLEIIKISSKEYPQQNEQKKAIIIGARVHPAETISSWVMERVMLQLVDNQNHTGKQLIQKYDFYILPMINIDGVTLGNYRTNLSGFDLNRTYIDPKQDTQPTIFYYKQFIANLQKESQVYFFLDIHCHSKKFNCFVYANPVPENQKNPFVSLMEKNIDFFSIKDCLYSISKEKEKSARVVMWKQMQIEHSYTLEMSYAGVDKGVLKNQHHSNHTVNNMARGILQSLLELEEEVKKQEQQLLQQQQQQMQLLESQNKISSQQSIDSKNSKQ